MASINGILARLTTGYGRELKLFNTNANTISQPDNYTVTNYVQAQPKSAFCVDFSLPQDLDFGASESVNVNISLNGRICCRLSVSKAEYDSAEKPLQRRIREYWPESMGAKNARKIIFQFPGVFDASSRRPQRVETRCTVSVVVSLGPYEGGSLALRSAGSNLANFTFRYRSKQQIQTLSLERIQVNHPFHNLVDRDASMTGSELETVTANPDRRNGGGNAPLGADDDSSDSSGKSGTPVDGSNEDSETIRGDGASRQDPQEDDQEPSVGNDGEIAPQDWQGVPSDGDQQGPRSEHEETENLGGHGGDGLHEDSANDPIPYQEESIELGPWNARTPQPRLKLEEDASIDLRRAQALRNQHIDESVEQLRAETLAHIAQMRREIPSLSDVEDEGPAAMSRNHARRKMLSDHEKIILRSHAAEDRERAMAVEAAARPAPPRNRTKYFFDLTGDTTDEE